MNNLNMTSMSNIQTLWEYIDSPDENILKQLNNLFIFHHNQHLIIFVMIFLK